MSKPVISVEHLSKIYRLGQIGTGTFSRDLEVWWAKVRGKPNPLLRIGEKDHGNRDGEELYALRDVSFTVQQGEVLGIIGRNGAGKSTLLKILSRVTAPTSGRIKVKGRIASLLEVGTGFHPELTGRENIYLNGAILGMSRKEIERKFDEIVDFAEIEKFIDTPVKRYSSGMYVRLAFAVAAHLESEILLVDEVLAVGDAEFQKKCLGKMSDVAHDGRTILFVSHNMAAVRQLCTQSIVLKNGYQIFNGKVALGLEAYINGLIENTGFIKDHISRSDPAVTIKLIAINGSPKDCLDLPSNIHDLAIVVNGSLSRELRMDIEVRIIDIYGSILALYSPGHFQGFAKKFDAGEFELKRTLRLPTGINRGEYYLNISLTDPNKTGWVDIDRAIRISAQGLPTKTGRVIDYGNNAGWLLLESGE